MYSMSYYKEQDQKKVIEFMHAHPFVMLCGSTVSGRPVATQVPMLILQNENKLYLRGHFMRKTDHHLAFTENSQVLAVFTGAHEYVSARWYANPQQASTWNYMSVHVRGKIKFTSDEELLAILEETTSRFENNPDSPASFDHLPHEYVERLSKAIVGFHIEVEEIENVFKLSQNRDRNSYENIVEQLQHKSADGKIIAKEMEMRTSQIFDKDK